MRVRRRSSCRSPPVTSGLDAAASAVAAPARVPPVVAWPTWSSGGWTCTSRSPPAAGPIRPGGGRARTAGHTLPDTPILATFRTIDEGGEAEISGEDYVALIEALAGTGLAAARRGIPPSAGGSGDRRGPTARHSVVASNHDFRATPPVEEIAGRLEAMQVAGGRGQDRGDATVGRRRGDAHRRHAAPPRDPRSAHHHVHGRTGGAHPDRRRYVRPRRPRSPRSARPRPRVSSRPPGCGPRSTSCTAETSRSGAGPPCAAPWWPCPRWTSVPS